MDELEGQVIAAKELLSKIYDQLRHCDTPDAVEWRKECSLLQNYDLAARTIIAVKGDSGNGKSTLINALLDEEAILPSSCAGACTSVVTEIAYNNRPDIRYRAEVKFISKTEWRAELNLILGSIADIGHKAPEKKSDEYAGYSKLKAVYADIPEEELLHETVEGLMSHPSTSALDTVEIIEENTAAAFHNRLKVYIDAKAKPSCQRDVSKSTLRIGVYWPMIRVVQIYVGADILKTGAVLVDLPGGNDNNTARVAVAEKYIMDCAGLFIVAPINRAVSERSAQELLGQTFKQQLKLDGSFEKVTFICSKTDDISITEAKDSFHVADQVDPLLQIEETLHGKLDSLKVALEKARATSCVSRENKFESAEVTNTQTNLCKAVVPYDAENRRDLDRLALTLCGKRKRVADSNVSRKKPALSTRSHLDCPKYDVACKDDGFETAQAPVDESMSSSQTFTSKWAELRNAHIQGRKGLVPSGAIRAEENIRSIQTQILEIMAEIALVTGLKYQICISARNNDSRTKIKRHFADGIKELDQNLIVKTDNYGNNGSTEHKRDYEKFANGLPVFCVSSRAFQKLKGRLKSEASPPGFETTESTEIPQLQNHCRQVAKSLHNALLTEFVNRVNILNNSLRLWHIGQSNSRDLGGDPPFQLTDKVHTILRKFFEDILNIGDGVFSRLQTHINRQIRDPAKIASQIAQKESVISVRRWNHTGIRWNTYKAIAVRGGCYNSSNGEAYDFNQDLVNPFVKHIANGWDNVFVVNGPKEFVQASMKLGEVIGGFRNEMNAIKESCSIDARQLQLLDKQLTARLFGLQIALTAARESIAKDQKRLNREFMAIIKHEMKLHYDACAKEGGTGCLDRMKAIMMDGVHRSKAFMFESCVMVLDNQTEEMIENTTRTLRISIKSTAEGIVQDCRQVFGG